jgi:hypothetical protein
LRLNPCLASQIKLQARQKPIEKRQQKHGTALAIEVIAENFNSPGCR